MSWLHSQQWSDRQQIDIKNDWALPITGPGFRARVVDKTRFADRIRGRARRLDRPDTCLHPTERTSAS
jgi:hypothetical protein